MSYVLQPKRQFTSRSSAFTLNVTLVENYPSKLSLGRLCDELFYSYSWQPKRNAQTDEKEGNSWMPHRKFRTPCGGGTAIRNSIFGYNSKRALPCKGKPCARERSGGHMLEAIAEEMIDKNAAVARTSLQAENGCGRKTMCKSEKTGKLCSEIESMRSKPRGDHNVFTHFPKFPNSDVCRMTKTTRSICKQTDLCYAPLGSHLSPRRET